MKKDIEWLKEEMYSMYPSYNEIYVSPDYETVVKVKIIDEVLELIDQLDESEQTDTNVGLSKPVIPQFVADYYNDYKSYELTFEEWFECEEFGKGGKTENKTFEWLLDNSHEVNIERQFILADIIAHGLEGYEVEKEPHYYVAFEGEFNLLYVTHVDIYGEDGKFNYSSVFDKKHALKFTDKSKAKYLADFLGAIVVEVTPCN